MAMSLLKKQYPNVKIDRYPDVFLAKGIFRRHAHCCKMMRNLIKTVKQSMRANILVLAVNPLRFGNSPEGVRAIKTDLNAHYPSVAVESLTMWGCNIVESVAIEARRLQNNKQSGVANSNSKRLAASILVSKEDQEAQKMLDAEATKIYNEIVKSKELPQAIKMAFEAGKVLGALDQHEWTNQLKRVHKEEADVKGAVEQLDLR
jgi:hypothetical protein